MNNLVSYEYFNNLLILISNNLLINKWHPNIDLTLTFSPSVNITISNKYLWNNVFILNRYRNVIKFIILETFEKGKLEKYKETFSAVLKEYFEEKSPSGLSNHPDYLLDLVSSSNCNSSIVSIVSDVMRDRSDYKLRYTRHLRPMTAVLKERKTSVNIDFNCSECLTDTDCDNLGQLVSVLKDGSGIRFRLDHSYDNYQPLNGEFYSQLKNSKLVHFTVILMVCISITK